MNVEFSNLSKEEGVADVISSLRKRLNSNESSSSQLLITSLPSTSSSRNIQQSSSSLLSVNKEVTPPHQEEIMANYSSNSMKGAISQKLTNSYLTNCFLEISVRLLLFIVFIQLERAPAFKRRIQPEELWLYKNPPTKDYVPASILLPASFIIPFTIICINFLLTNDKYDFMKSINVISLTIPINGVLTSLIKITTGRPRPDFFYRCYPDGIINGDIIGMNCTGEEHVINEGRKSFPSGHSSFAFAGFGFVFFYLASKLHCFNDKGRGQSWRMCITITPLLIALLVAISRTCDYHHHWQDVLIGSIIGITIVWICYRQYYPSIFSSNCHRPYGKNNLLSSGKCYVAVTNDNSNSSSSNHRHENGTGDHNDQTPLIEEAKDTKWI